MTDCNSIAYMCRNMWALRQNRQECAFYSNDVDNDDDDDDGDGDYDNNDDDSELPGEGKKGVLFSP